MQYIKDKFNIVTAFFAIYLSKTVVFSPTYQDSIILLGLFSLLGFSLYLKSREPKEVNIQIKKDVQMLKDELGKVKLDKAVGPKKPFKF